MTSKLALLVVDVQEDFCPPNGALAVPDGRAILPAVHALLAQPFALKVATQDYHPAKHVSFATNHAGAAPFTSSVTIANPANPRETYASTLWPPHCVAGTRGAALVAGLDAPGVFDTVVRKGTDPRVEMYSAFRSPLRDPPLASAVSELGALLRRAGVERVVVVGLAGDYCVKCSAVDAAEDGWETYVVEEGTRCVGGEQAWAEVKQEMEGKGVRIVSLEWVNQVRSGSMIELMFLSELWRPACRIFSPKYDMNR
ncbi:hypothetical protein PHLGIDRAFT_488857 [Phlebiopsis gigantea 11061_1 CR5-6]|uniref:nicotinamidase n=1 Tax=Phlebiopsis gigantea (strain 11061_1 CR5-6) TaxID=745531 RepID=A0A0C3S850_PHLG1|nr:hypothetical protein PHLGIDRAFT_488857 [Phlebiopsis gigantea 11061_1 CR5-6]